MFNNNNLEKFHILPLFPPLPVTPIVDPLNVKIVLYGKAKS